MDIPQEADCIYGVYLRELRDPDGNLIPDQNPDFTELDFRADLYSRWLNARAGFQRCAFARR